MTPDELQSMDDAGLTRPVDGAPREPTEPRRAFEDLARALPERARASALPADQAPPYEGRETDEERTARVRLQRAALEEVQARRSWWWTRRVPVRFTDARLDALRPSQDPDGKVRGFLDGSAPTLLLVGDTGVGKSYAAYAVGHAAVADHRWTIGGTVGELVDKLRKDQGDGGGQMFTDLIGADLVIFDELGVERGTEFSLEMVQRIVDERWRNKLPLVVTTNLNAEQIADRYGARLLDRILDGAVIVRMTGNSARHLKAF